MFFPKSITEVRQNEYHGVLRLRLFSASYDWDFLPIEGGSFKDRGQKRDLSLRILENHAFSSSFVIASLIWGSTFWAITATRPSRSGGISLLSLLPWLRCAYSHGA